MQPAVRMHSCSASPHSHPLARSHLVLSCALAVSPSRSLEVTSRSPSRYATSHFPTPFPAFVSVPLLSMCYLSRCHPHSRSAPTPSSPPTLTPSSALALLRAHTPPLHLHFHHNLLFLLPPCSRLPPPRLPRSFLRSQLPPCLHQQSRANHSTPDMQALLLALFPCQWSVLCCYSLELSGSCVEG